MTINKYFEILETKSSVIIHIHRCIRFVPGYFLMLLLFSTFFLSAVLDLLFIILIFLLDNKLLIGMVFLAIAFGPITFIIIFNVSHIYNFKNENSLPTKWYHYVCLLFTLYFGLFSLNTRRISIKSIFEERLERCGILFPLFHLPNEVIATLKIYCFFFSISKSIPQLFAIPALLVTHKVNMWTALIGRISILHNMVLLSLTMAILFPVRKTPRYFPSLSVAFLNALSKFFGGMCASGLRVIVFTEIFKTMGFHALLIQFLRLGLPLWPCLKALYEICPNHSYFYIIIYAPLIGTVLSFLYIHPFSLKGRLYYYIIHLLNFLIDIFSLYVLTEANNECIIIMILLTVISIGCLSSFGLINLFIKRLCKMVCLPERLISQEFESEKESSNFFFHETKNINT